MAEMGSIGGKIGGKKRAEKMTPEDRKRSASLAARARWNKEPMEETQETRRQRAAQEIAAILEKAMDDMGLTEAQKDAKVAEMTAIVKEAIESKNDLRATQRERLHIAASHA